MWRGIVSDDIGIQISSYLRSNWNEFGSQTPEWNDDIATFSGSIEVIAHAAVGEIQTSLDLIALSWGYMLESTNSTNSTFWEGYLKNGQFGYQVCFTYTHTKQESKNIIYFAFNIFPSHIHQIRMHHYMYTYIYMYMCLNIYIYDIIHMIG
jgi:hypothetical protein